MAYAGYGVWSLVVKVALMAFIDTLLLWIMNPWKPKWVFSNASFKRLFGFGSKILLSSLLDRFYQQIYKLIIGKYFSSAMLGFYTQANNFSNIIVSTLFRTLDKVTYPVLAKLQEDKIRLKSGFRKVVKMSSFFIIPSMVVLGILAKPIIVTLIGEKWLQAVPFLQLLCLSGATLHLSQINLNMLLVLGRSDLGLKLEIIKKINITIAIIIGIQFGVFGLIIGEVISSYINLVINTYYSKRMLNYSLFEQMRDVFMTLFFSLLTGLTIIVVIYLIPQWGILQVILGSLSGITCYLGLHYLVQTEEMEILRSTIIPKTLNLIKS
jgi:O-antigen/teichoic acid export membrane protein